MIFVLLAAIGVLVVGSAFVAFGRRTTGDDVERFNRARQMTTEWSRRYAATGHLELPRPASEPAPRPEPEPAERR